MQRKRPSPVRGQQRRVYEEALSAARTPISVSLPDSTMMNVDRILFATDGSDCAERARGHAVQFAERFEATLHVVHVEERETELSDVIDVRESDVLADLHALDTGASAVAKPRVQERQVAYSSAAGGILSYTVEHDIHLIVLGTHGRRGVQRLVLGSVAEEVLRRAPCPVLTVGRGARAQTSLQGGTLLVPIDFSDHQDQLLAHATELALVYDMALVLFHAIEFTELPNVYGVYSHSPEPGGPQKRTREAMENVAKNLRTKGVETHVEVRNGHAAEEILETADEFDCDLLTIATHGRSGIDRILMGSVTEKVLRRARCPVFTVKSVGMSLVSSSPDGDPSHEN